MFGKAMKLPDHLVTLYLRQHTMVPLADVDAIDAAIAAGELNPMQAKRTLGRALVERYHSAAGAAREEEWFARVFSGRSIPDDVPEVAVTDPNITLLELLRRCLPTESASALRRLVAAGSVRLDGTQPLTDPEMRHPVSSGDVIKVGRRRWYRITFGG
jgi:tyrosyl-tRNA synthetase